MLISARRHMRRPDTVLVVRVAGRVMVSVTVMSG